ncbi:MAG: delta-60 repeat domain-containing protein, partial [Candidatus Thiodiazotropha sp.]
MIVKTFLLPLIVFNLCNKIESRNIRCWIVYLIFSSIIKGYFEVRLFLYFTLTGITVMLITSPLFAKPGDLDAGFGTTGHVITSLGGESYVNALTVQADGKILAAGYTTNGTDTDIALVRYNADGSLDTGFNGYGIVLSPLGLENEYATDIAVQPNGKILVSGAMVIDAIAEFVIVRYNSDGSLDASFGTGGYTHTPIGSSHAFGRALALQADGKILV